MLTVACLLHPLDGLQDPVAAGEWGDGQRQVPWGASLLPILEGVLLLEIFVLLIKEAVLQSISAVWAGRCLAGSLVFLDGLIEAVQLAEQGHVQLSEANPAMILSTQEKLSGDKTKFQVTLHTVNHSYSPATSLVQLNRPRKRAVHTDLAC